MARRIGKEYSTLTEKPLDWLHIELPDANDLYNWNATIQGPSETPYAKGWWTIRLQLPPDYPFKPPTLIFKTPIYHPNVNSKDGHMCDQWLRDLWSPQLTIEQVLIMVRTFLKEPNLEQPIEAEIASLYTKDKSKYIKNVEEHTKKHASESPKK